jgi:GTP:adenosylcobinamide-phosphate guanylyltransferase
LLTFYGEDAVSGSLAATWSAPAHGARPSAQTFNAFLLAGSRGGIDPVARYADVADKAMIVIDGQTMLSRVVTALRQAGAVRIVVAVSSPEVRDHALSLGVETIAAAGGPSESAARGLEMLGAPLLVTTCDHALLDPAWVKDFIAEVPTDADVAVLVAHRSAIERDVPQTKRTYLRFADGPWSGCNLFYLATPRALKAVDFWRQVEGDRKRPWRIVRRLGPVFLLRYGIGRLKLGTALSHVGKLAGLCACMVVSSSGFAAVDVDKPADLDLVRRLSAS